MYGNAYIDGGVIKGMHPCLCKHAGVPYADNTGIQLQECRNRNITELYWPYHGIPTECRCED